MGVRIGSSGSNLIQNGSLANGVATVVAKTGIFGLTQDNAQVFIQWFAICTTGVGATSITPRIQRNFDAAPATINVAANVAVLASSVILLSGCYTDLPGVVAAAQYGLVLTVNGGAAALTIQDTSIIAFVL